MKVKLLSCCCGSKNIKFVNNGTIIYIRCENCYRGLLEEIYENTVKETVIKKLIEEWNKTIPREFIEIEYKER